MTRRVLVILTAAALGACGGAKPEGKTPVDAAGAPDAVTAQDRPSVVDAREDASSPAEVAVAGDGAGATAPDVADAPGEVASAGGDARADAVADAVLASAAWPAITDYGAKGPFAVARDLNTGPGGAYDVFRPAILGAEARRHPIVSWANGTLFGIADYQKLLEHWASHGFVVIAGHTNSTAGGGTHKAAIDWMIAEAARAGGPYNGVLDTKMVGAAGHSQGGGATIAAGAQKAGATTLVTTLPLMPILSYESDKSILGKQTVPMLNINATMDDRDPQHLIPDQIFDAAKTELVQAAFIGIHEDAMTAAMFAPTLAWFRARLMGDVAARATFAPVPTCGLCTNAAWKQVRAKNVP